MRNLVLFASSVLCLLALNPHNSFAQGTDSGTLPKKHVVYGSLADQANTAHKRAGGTARLETSKPVADKTVRDESGRITKIFEPDATGKLTIETDFEYDGAGKLASIKQLGAAGDPVRSRTFVRDASGKLISQTSPEQGKTDFTLDEKNFILSTTDARGVTRTHVYDERHRLLSKTYSDGSPAAHFHYWSRKQPMFVAFSGDKGGQDLQKVERYNKLGALDAALQKYPDNSYATARVAYDQLGHIIKIYYPDGRILHQAWNQKGQLTSIKSGDDRYFGDPQYTGANDLLSASLSAGLTLRKAYDDSGRLSELSILQGDQVLFGHRYHYNAFGSVERLDDLTTTRAVDFSYDPLNRVAHFKDSDGGGRTFAYDAAGNLEDTSIADGNNSVDEHNRLHSSAGLSYDAAGEMTFDGVHSYTFNAENLITSVDGGRVRYVYNAMGDLIARVSTKGTEEFLWLFGQLLAKRETDGTWTDFIYGNGQRIASIHKPLPTKERPEPKDEVTFFVTDGVGLARAAVKADGTLTAAAVFTPFGEPLGGTPLAKAAKAISYSGEVPDSYTGLDIYQFRSYNPHLGRWMSPDPSGLRFADLTNPQTFNLYTFVVNDPMKYFDAHGLFAEDGSGDDDGNGDEDGGQGGGPAPVDGGDDGGDGCGGRFQVPCVTPVDICSVSNTCQNPPDPGTGNPGTGDPGTGNPGTGDPGTGNPGTGDPGTGNPGTGDPGSGDPGTGDPGDSDPGGGASGGSGDPGTGDPGGSGGPYDPCVDSSCTEPGGGDPPQPGPGTNQPLPLPTQKDTTKVLVSGLNGPDPQLMSGTVGHVTVWYAFHLNGGNLGAPLSVNPYSGNPKDDPNTTITLWQKSQTGGWYWDGSNIGHGQDNIATGNSGLTGNVDQIWGINGVQVPLLMGKDANGKPILAWVIHVDRSGKKPIYTVLQPATIP